MAVTDRFLEPRDEEILKQSLAADEFHKDTDFTFFSKPGTVTKVYEDEKGPICFVRATKALRLDIQYASNEDRRRNMTAMLAGFDNLAIKARENGFTEIVFTTNSDMLRKFCMKVFGFVDCSGELRKFLA